MPQRAPTARLCVLASGSGGNCSVLEVASGDRRSLVLIDLGLSPRHTALALRELDLALEDIDLAVLTHPDGDHLRPLWFRRRTPPPSLIVGAAHAPTVRALGAPPQLISIFEDRPEPIPGIRLSAVNAPHDELGSNALRFDVEGCGALGFATDLGTVPDRVTRLLEGVDVLAIESNHCPRMQMASPRPESLKRRVLGPRGHLSNHQCLEGIERIGPKSHVVLLHLSGECNDPALVSGLHDGADYALTIASQHTPTRWVRIGGPTSAYPRSLFDAVNAPA